MKKVLAVALLSSAFAAPVFAADNGFYVVGQVGQSSNIQTVNNSTSYGALVGYQINRHWGVEGGYTSLYKDATWNPNVGGLIGKYSVNAVSVAAVYTFPINEQFAVLGRLGIHNISENASAYGGGLSATSSNTATGMLYGVAGQYNLNESIGFRAGFDFYNVNTNGSSGTYHNLNAGVIYKF